MTAGRRRLLLFVAAHAVVTAAHAAVFARDSGARPGFATRMSVWRIASYNFSYDETAAREACSPAFSYPSGYDIGSETVHFTVSGLGNSDVIRYAYPFGAARPHRGGPNAFAPVVGGARLRRQIRKDLVRCGDKSVRTSACGGTLTVPIGYQREYRTGSFTVITNRARGTVAVRLFAWEDPDFSRLSHCPSDLQPAMYLGPPVSRAALVELRATLPLEAFARPATTVMLEKTLRRGTAAGEIAAATRGPAVRMHSPSRSRPDRV